MYSWNYYISKPMFLFCDLIFCNHDSRFYFFQFSIENRSLPGIASDDILVKLKNNLKMDWTVDEAGTFIIEEFAVSQELTPGQSNIVEFQVTTVGVFPMIFKTSDGVETNILGLKVIEQRGIEG